MFIETYKVGIYLRLSREDENQGESGSIINQRDIIHKYIKDNKLSLVSEYIDDGVSGTTFDRTGFQQMIQDISVKKINMIITKDLSRFGRNEGQQLRYLDYFFENDIRYVSILDNVDTADEYNTSNEMMPLQFFFNEKHVRDTSKKMKASVYNKRINGNFLGSTAPYGYIKDPDNKYKLIIDPTAAKIVVRIFNMFVSGIGISKICQTLTDEKIPIPSEHKKLNRGLKSSAYGVWTTRTVSDMLRLPTYAGDLTQGRLKKPSYKSKRIVRQKQEDWIICKNKCPAIIDRDTFELASSIYNINKNQGKNTQDILLKGFVYCKECNHTIGFRLQKAYTKKYGEVKRCYGNCNYWSKHKKLNVCTPHNIKYYELEALVLSDIKKMFINSLRKDDLLEVLKKNEKIIKFQKDLEIQLNRLNLEVEASTNKTDALYVDKLEGVIDTEMYKRISNQIYKDTINKQKEIKELEHKLSNIKHKILNKSENHNKIISEYLSMKKPSVQLLSNIIEKIVIDENMQIDIYYKVKSFEHNVDKMAIT